MRTEEQVRDRKLLLALDELAGRETPPDRVYEVRARREAGEEVIDHMTARRKGRRTGKPWIAAALVVLGLGVTTGIRVMSTPLPQHRIAWIERADSQRTGYYPGGLGQTKIAPLVFVFDGPETLLALDLRTGKPRWEAKLPRGDYCSPLVHGGVVHMGSMSQFCAIDATTGHLLWQRDMDQKDGYRFFPGRRLPVAFSGGVLYCSLLRRQDGQLQGRYSAIHARTGRLLWSFDAEGTFAGHALVGGRIYAACTDGYLYALDMTSGHKDWATELGFERPQSPLFHDGRVYVAGDDGVCAVSVAKGRIEWQQQLAGIRHNLCTPSLSKSSDYLFVGETTLYCLRRKDGKTVWSHPGVTLRGAPIVHDDIVITGNMVWHGVNRMKALGKGGVPGGAGGVGKPALLAFDRRTGKVRWKNDQISDILREMAVAHGFVCAISRERVALFAFEASTGKMRWKHDLRRPNLTAPCIADSAATPGKPGKPKENDK